MTIPFCKCPLVGILFEIMIIEFEYLNMNYEGWIEFVLLLGVPYSGWHTKGVIILLRLLTKYSHNPPATIK